MPLLIHQLVYNNVLQTLRGIVAGGKVVVDSALTADSAADAPLVDSSQNFEAGQYAGDPIYVLSADQKSGEFATIDDCDGASIALTAPLSADQTEGNRYLILDPDQAGFSTTLNVEEEKQLGNSPRDALCVLKAEKLIPQPPEIVTCMHDGYWLPCIITVYSISDETNEMAIWSRLGTFAADVRKALLTDRQRGGLAVNTEFKDADEFFTAASPKCVKITALVNYRTLIGNPYQQ